MRGKQKCLHQTILEKSGRVSYLKGVWKYGRETHDIDHEIHSSQLIHTLRSVSRHCLRTDSAVRGNHITYPFLSTSQIVECQIKSFWQPTRAFTNLFIPAAGSTQHSLPVFTPLLGSPTVMFNPCSHSALVPWLTEDAFGQSAASTSMAGNDNEATVDLRGAAGLEIIQCLSTRDGTRHLRSNARQK